MIYENKFLEVWKEIILEYIVRLGNIEIVRCDYCNKRHCNQLWLV